MYLSNAQSTTLPRFYNKFVLQINTICPKLKSFKEVKLYITSMNTGCDKLVIGK